MPNPDKLFCKHYFIRNENLVKMKKMLPKIKLLLSPFGDVANINNDQAEEDAASFVLTTPKTSTRSTTSTSLSPSNNNTSYVQPGVIPFTATSAAAAVATGGLQQQQPSLPQILWSCVARDDIVLAEVMDVEQQQYHYRKKDVIHAARQLLEQGHTPGFEYYTHPNNNNHKLQRLFQTKKKKKKNRLGHAGGDDEVVVLKGIKFHLYENVSVDSMHFGHPNSVDKTTTTPPPNKLLRLWVFAAVYDSNNSTMTRQMVQSFLETLVHCTDSMRLYDPEWKVARTLGLQTSFGPILVQHMKDVTSRGRVAILQQQVQTLQDQMEHNIQLILDNTGRAADLKREASRLKELCHVFQKQAKTFKRHHMLQNAKYGMVVGTVVTGLAAAILVPILL